MMLTVICHGLVRYRYDKSWLWVRYIVDGHETPSSYWYPKLYYTKFWDFRSFQGVKYGDFIESVLRESPSLMMGVFAVACNLILEILYPTGFTVLLPTPSIILAPSGSSSPVGRYSCLASRERKTHPGESIDLRVRSSFWDSRSFYIRLLPQMAIVAFHCGFPRSVLRVFSVNIA